MITHFFTILFSIFVVEIIKLLDLVLKLKKIFSISKKIIKIIISKKISDNWKEKFLLKSSFMLLINSFQIIMVLLIILTLFFIGTYLNDEFFSFILSLAGLCEMTISIFLYITIKKYFNAKL